MTEVVYLTLNQALAGAVHVLGAGHDRVRDVGLLDAAINRPRASVFGQDAYPTLDGKAAALLHSIVSSHPFVDGNKRMGWAAVVIFYRLNGRAYLGADLDDTAFALVMDIAKGTLAEVDAIAPPLGALFS